MATFIPQYFHHEVRRAVDDLGMLGEAGFGVDETAKAHTLDDLRVIIVHRGSKMRQYVEPALLCRLPGGIQLHFVTHPPHESALAVFQWQLPGNKHEVARA